MLTKVGAEIQRAFIRNRVVSCGGQPPTGGHVSAHYLQGLPGLTWSLAPKRRQGGTSIEHPCEACADHGFDGVEQETVDRINAWMLAGK